MDIDQIIAAVVALTAIIGGGWRGYRAIERQAYERVKAESRLDTADAALDQMTRERDRLDEQLDWWERQEGPRLHERIRTLEAVLTRLSQGRPP